MIIVCNVNKCNMFLIVTKLAWTTYKLTMTLLTKTCTNYSIQLYLRLNNEYVKYTILTNM